MLWMPQPKLKEPGPWHHGLDCWHLNCYRRWKQILSCFHQWNISFFLTAAVIFILMNTDVFQKSHSSRAGKCYTYCPLPYNLVTPSPFCYPARYLYDIACPKEAIFTIRICTWFFSKYIVCLTCSNSPNGGFCCKHLFHKQTHPNWNVPFHCCSEISHLLSVH